jgi:hypothetical protein
MVSLGDNVDVGGAAPRYILVGIAAIIDTEAQHLEHEDIRNEHLSWAKFVEVMQDMDKVYDCNKLKLVYVVPKEGSQSAEVEICDEDTFRWAVGVLYWHVKKEDLGRPLTMLLKTRYRY